MATDAQYARGVRVTESGNILNGRPTKVSTLGVYALGTDTTVRLRDGGATAAIVWEAEGDNAASGHTTSFDPPLRFFQSCYVEVSGGANSSVSLAVIEP